jgi:hypothetical protein
MVVPPLIDDDDVTPPRVSTGTMEPLVRVPLDEIPRTTTRDIVKQRADAVDQLVDPEADTVVIPDDEITPVDIPLPKRAKPPKSPKSPKPPRLLKAPRLPKPPSKK